MFFVFFFFFFFFQAEVWTFSFWVGFCYADCFAKTSWWHLTSQWLTTICLLEISIGFEDYSTCHFVFSPDQPTKLITSCLMHLRSLGWWSKLALCLRVWNGTGKVFITCIVITLHFLSPNHHLHFIQVRIYS